MEIQQQIELFLAGTPHAVVGASDDRRKYGNKVLRAYLQTDRLVFPVNLHAAEIEGLEAYARLSDLPQSIHGISIVTPPPVTEKIVTESIQLGIPHIWMQPGSESKRAVEQAQASGANVIADGPCLLVALRFRETPNAS